MENNENIDFEVYENSKLLLQAIKEDTHGNKGRKSTEATHYTYSHFDEYFDYLCTKRLMAEGYIRGIDDWCYAGCNCIKNTYYKVYFVKYMNDGYEVIEFYVSQLEFDKIFPNTYPTMVPLILREDGTYIAGNTIDECIYRIYYTDDRGIEHEGMNNIYNFHFHNRFYNGEKDKDTSWYRIIDSNTYKPV